MGRQDPTPIPKEITAALDGRGVIELVGEIDKALLDQFLKELARARQKAGPIVLAITSSGGDPDLARRIQLEIERVGRDRRLLFLGKSVVYSAAVSIMAAFPRQDRFLTLDTVLLIHGRELDLTLSLSGPLKLSRPRLEAVLGEIETGLKLEEEDFRRLIAGTDLTIEELVRKATRNWYLTAEEAKACGLVAGVV